MMTLARPLASSGSGYLASQVVNRLESDQTDQQCDSDEDLDSALLGLRRRRRRGPQGRPLGRTCTARNFASRLLAASAPTACATTTRVAKTPWGRAIPATPPRRQRRPRCRPPSVEGAHGDPSQHLDDRHVRGGTVYDWTVSPWSGPPLRRRSAISDSDLRVKPWAKEAASTGRLERGSAKSRITTAPCTITTGHRSSLLFDRFRAHPPHRGLRWSHRCRRQSRSPHPGRQGDCRPTARSPQVI